MALSLNLSTTTGLFYNFDAPTCNDFYGHTSNLRLEDCWAAWRDLEVSETVKDLHPLRRTLLDPPSLLMTQNHGTCELRFHASGKWVEEANDFAVPIVPNSIRDMFEVVIRECVQNQGVGGMVPRGRIKPLSWLLQAKHEFPGEPPRDPGLPRTLHIPRNTTFLTAMVWNRRANARQFEPGANDPDTTVFFMRVLQLVADTITRIEPDGATELRNRVSFLDGMWEKQVDFSSPPWTWWGTRRRLIAAGAEEPAGVENGGLALLNTTGMQGTNVSIPGLDNSLGVEEDCAQTSGGPARGCSSIIPPFEAE